MGSVPINWEKNIRSNCVNYNGPIVQIKKHLTGALPGGVSIDILLAFWLPNLKEYPFVSNFKFWNLLKLCCTVAPWGSGYWLKYIVTDFQGSNESRAHLLFEALQDCQIGISFHSLSLPTWKQCFSCSTVFCVHYFLL